MAEAAVDQDSTPASNLLNEDETLVRAESVRRATLNHEISIRSLGALYLFAAIAASVLTVVASLLRPENIFVVVLAGLIAGACSGVGYGLYGLHRWSRVPGVVVSAVGLLAFPIGTLTNSYFVYLLVCRKGRYVFSDEYAEIRALTPQVKYRSYVLWVVIGVLVLLTALSALAPLWVAPH